MTSPAEPRTLTMFLGHGGLMAVTLDPEGDNLPRPQGPWRKVGEIEAVDEAAYRSIAAKGYWLLESGEEIDEGSARMPNGRPGVR